MQCKHTAVLCALIILCMFHPVYSCAEESKPILMDQGVDLPGGSVHFPTLTQFPDEKLSTQIQQSILAAGNIKSYLAALPVLNHEENKLDVSWRGFLQRDLLSIWFHASGDAVSNQPPHRWMSLSVDLSDGHTVQLNELFKDWTQTATFLTQYLTEQVSPSLSAHLQNTQIVPVPDMFYLSEAGITLLYPFDQLSTLADRSGAVTIDWGTLSPYLQLEPGSLLARSGLDAMVTLSESSAERLLHDATEGKLSGLPIQLGEPVQPLIDRYHLLVDPDLYDSGRMVLLDDALFRDIWLLTDKLSDSFENSVIQGIRMDRGCLWGIFIGETTQADWRTVFGEPESSFSLDEEEAEASRLVPGTSDYYQAGPHQLRFHADDDGILRTIILQ